VLQRTKTPSKSNRNTDTRYEGKGTVFDEAEEAEGEDTVLILFYYFSVTQVE
jgi:hypothetical protein